MQEEVAEERALLRAAERKGALLPNDLELAEDAELKTRRHVRHRWYGGACINASVCHRLLDVVGVFTRRFLPRPILRDVQTRPNLCPVGKRGLTVVLLLAVLVSAPAVEAFDIPARLTAVARTYSLGVGEVRCASRGEWDADFASSFGMAYTNMRDDYAVLGPLVCAGALNVGSPAVPLWQQALGVLVLTHEAFHLRHWRFRRNEAKVECQAIVHFKDAAQRLGATVAEAENLYPYALALHAHQVRLLPGYRDPQCRIPPWNPPFG